MGTVVVRVRVRVRVRVYARACACARACAYPCARVFVVVGILTVGYEPVCVSVDVCVRVHVHVQVHVYVCRDSRSICVVWFCVCVWLTSGCAGRPSQPVLPDPEARSGGHSSAANHHAALPWPPHDPTQGCVRTSRSLRLPKKMKWQQRR